MISAEGRRPRLAVFIPCLNEAATISRVVKSALAALPGARIYVFDNNSTDATGAEARRAGATVIPSPAPGKGAVVRHAFAILDADYLLMLDGDDTYPVAEAPRLIERAIKDQCDMVCGTRLERAARAAFRPLHRVGNVAISAFVRRCFGPGAKDVLTGFRVFSIRFARNLRLDSVGFEIETELTARALAEGARFTEVEVDYAPRPRGSRSKLKTFRDGARILRTIWRLRREYRTGSRLA